jgi:hypothetical protein
LFTEEHESGYMGVGGGGNVWGWENSETCWLTYPVKILSIGKIKYGENPLPIGIIGLYSSTTENLKKMISPF